MTEDQKGKNRKRPRACRVVLALAAGIVLNAVIIPLRRVADGVLDAVAIPLQKATGAVLDTVVIPFREAGFSDGLWRGFADIFKSAAQAWDKVDPDDQVAVLGVLLLFGFILVAIEVVIYALHRVAGRLQKP